MDILDLTMDICLYLVQLLSNIATGKLASPPVTYHI